jgi:hypothetical protein
LRHPGATCRGVGGHHAVSLKPLLGTSPVSGFLPLHVVMFVLSSAAMAPKTRSADFPPATLADSLDLRSLQSLLAPAPYTLALVLKQMALINAQTADVADAVAPAVADPLVTQRRHNGTANPRVTSSPWTVDPCIHGMA